MNDDPLARLAGLLADGVEVDWERAEVDAALRGELDDVRGLRALATLAATLGRELAPENSVPPPRTWGPLRLRERIGAGSFGDVYRAFDPQLRREVALKLLHARSVAAGAPLLSEARRLARVRHPNVIVVHGAEEHDGRPGLWMEFVSGRTLAEIVAERGTFSASEATLIGLELCRALAAVHAAGLVHGDVKASNVMRANDGRILLMDFGALAERGALGVTPLYASPEVLAGSAPSAAADIYALGVLLFHLVTRSYPVEAHLLDALRAAHSAGARRRLRDLRPELPAAFVSAVEGALARAGERFASAAALERALVQSQAQPARATRGSRWLWLSPVLAAALLLAFLMRPVASPTPNPISQPVAPVPTPGASELEAAAAVPSVEEPAPSPTEASLPSPSPTPSAFQLPLPVVSPVSWPEPTKSGASPTDAPHKIDPAVETLDAALAALVPKANRVEELEASFAANCAGVHMTNEKNIEWVPPAELKCRATTQEIGDQRREIRKALIQAEDDARRARVLPGEVRALREKYTLGALRWELP